MCGEQRAVSGERTSRDVRAKRGQRERRLVASESQLCEQAWNRRTMALHGGSRGWAGAVLAVDLDLGLPWLSWLGANEGAWDWDDTATTQRGRTCTYNCHLVSLCETN